jgi:hypothetical protein
MSNLDYLLYLIKGKTKSNHPDYQLSIHRLGRVDKYPIPIEIS